MALAIGTRLGRAEEQLGELALTIGLLVQDDQDDDEEDDLDGEDVGGGGSGGAEVEEDGSEDEDEEEDDDDYPPRWSDSTRGCRRDGRRFRRPRAGAGRLCDEESFVSSAAL